MAFAPPALCGRMIQRIFARSAVRKIPVLLQVFSHPFFRVLIYVREFINALYLIFIFTLRRFLLCRNCFFVIFSNCPANRLRLRGGPKSILWTPLLFRAVTFDP